MNILVLYNQEEFPLRATIRDHLYSFRNYSSDRCFYLNVRTRGVPWYLSKIQFDLIIFHTIFLSARWHLNAFRDLVNKVRVLKRMDAVKVALPQDDFIHTDILCDFINEFKVNYVFSAASEPDRRKIYSSVDLTVSKFFKVLTGYLDDETVNKVNRLAKSVKERTIDIGYRAWRSAPWLGRHGLLKAQIADLFQKEAPPKGLVTDISTRSEDTFLGDEWYRFLLRCKYMIGVEGGASILDRDGSIKRRTEEYLSRHPQASFEEVETNCFPNLDGYLHLFATSPRHLEACSTKTCQVLVEGQYDGILFPGQHYIELKRDLSNLDEVLETIKRDELRDEIVERAYRDVVASGRYSYRSFVELVLGEALKDVESQPQPFLHRVFGHIIYYWMRVFDASAWTTIKLSSEHYLALLKGGVKKIIRGSSNPARLNVLLKKRYRKLKRQGGD
jgi:hypothetical protein